MKSNTFSYFGLIAIAFVFMVSLGGCKTTERTIDTKIEYIETTRDSLIYMPADSSVLKALFACDSTNQVYIKQLSQRQGQRSQISTNATPVNSGYVIEAICVCDSMQIYMTMKDRYLSRTKLETKVSTGKGAKARPVLSWLRAFFYGTIAGIVFTIISILLIRFYKRAYGIKK